jgi:hypothetical protein
MTFRPFLPAAVVAVSVVAAALAQAPASRPTPAAAATTTTTATTRPGLAMIDRDAPNLVHGRHLHPHNPKHPAAPDAARFTTSRPGALPLPLPAEEGAFTFAVFGDRTTGPADGVNVLADAVRDVNLLEPDLVMTVGDLVQGYNEAPEYAEQAKEYKAIMNRLTAPWFPVAGNHDVYWRDKDKSGDARPKGENERQFETHFGPLWYAFSHKNAWFIVLFSDEGDPKTGQKAFNKPEAQQISDEQLAWLKQTLAKAKGADHVFLFLHHPRWLGTRGKHEGYGDSWARVHKALVEAGNVTAVFAGHVHRMRHDAKDGIEYVTLAATGGGLGGDAQAAGWLHHYHVVTVRKRQVAMAAFPVGAAVDVREMTGDLTEQTGLLARTEPAFEGPIALRSDGAADSVVKVRVANPTSRPVEYTLAPDSDDSRWVAEPDHHHQTLKPGESATVEFRVRRQASAIDETFRPIELAVDAEYLAPAHRYPIPTKRPAMPLDLTQIPARPMALALDGQTAPSVPSRHLALPAERFTLEARVRARAFKKRQGLLSKMQNSGYGIFLNDGRPSASVWVGDSYLAARAPDDMKLETDRWYHLAQVFDAGELRLYVDGKLAARAKRNGDMKDNALPLVLGGDVARRGAAVDTLDGDLDAVRLSTTARYTGESFAPPAPGAAVKSDDATLLLLNFDRALGRHLVDESPARRLLPTVTVPRLVGTD